MKPWNPSLLRVTAIASLTLLGACTQMPTEKQGISDLRPQISFRLERPELAQSQVRVNGLDMGQAGQFQDGQASLKLLPGTHHLQVLWSNQALIDQRFYVADGVHKSFVLK